MAAIAGVLYPEYFPISYAVKRALDVLEGRSNGKVETYVFKNMEIGARGEKIGHDDHNTISLVLDGEIQNPSEIKSDLRSAGFRTEGLSLCDILVRAYEHWDLEFVEHLKGSFAIGIYDQKKQTLILLRDRLGIKPLYWSYTKGYLLFASELKAILATGLVPQSPATDAIGAYLLLGYIPQDLSPIQEVNKLLPSHYLRLGPKGDLKVQHYWSYSSLLKVNLAIGPEEIAKELDQRLKLAVSKELSQGETGYTATSSIGSTALGYYLQDTNAQALSMDFAGQEAAKITTTLPQKNYTLSPTDFLDELIPTVWRLDEPLAGPLALGLHRLFEQSAGTIQKLFSHVGYVEILAAHPRYQVRHGEIEHPGLLRIGRKCVQTILPLLRRIDKKSAFRLLRRAYTKPWLHDYIVKQALFPPATLNQMSPQIARIFDPDIFIQRFYDLAGLGDSPSAHLFLDTRTVLCDRLLLQYDRLSAPFDIKWTSPFLDHNVVEFMAQVPEYIKLSPEQSPLTKILSQQYPEAAFTTSPLTSPKFLSSWIYDASIQRAFEYLEQGTLVEAGWISRRWLRHALRGKTTPPSTFLQLWSILALEVWFRLYINFPIEKQPPDLPLIQLLQMG